MVKYSAQDNTCRCDEIGRRSGLKIRGREPCRFESGQRHQKLPNAKAFGSFFVSVFAYPNFCGLRLLRTSYKKMSLDLRRRTTVLGFERARKILFAGKSARKGDLADRQFIGEQKLQRPIHAQPDQILFRRLCKILPEFSLQARRADKPVPADFSDVQPGVAEMRIDIRHAFGKRRIADRAFFIFRYRFQNLVKNGFCLIYGMFFVPGLQQFPEQFFDGSRVLQADTFRLGLVAVFQMRNDDLAA